MGRASISVASPRAKARIGEGPPQAPIADFRRVACCRYDRRMSYLAVIGASSVAQLDENVAARERLDFTEDELREIDRYAVDSDVDLWAEARAGGPLPTLRP